MSFKFTSGKVLVCLSALALLGCNSGTSTGPGAATSEHADHHEPTPEGAKLMLSAAPEGSQTVIAAREAVKDGDDVVVKGRIGGSMEPWVEGRAAFQIVDPSLVPCSEKPGDSCPTPWDYCCDTDRLPKALAMVKFVGEDGQTLGTDAREMFGLTELQTVIIQGKAKRDEAGNLVVLAQKLFAEADGHHDHEHAASEGHEHHDHAHDHEHADHDHAADGKSSEAVPATNETQQP